MMYVFSVMSLPCLLSSGFLKKGTSSSSSSSSSLSLARRPFHVSCELCPFRRNKIESRHELGTFFSLSKEAAVDQIIQHAAFAFN